MRLRRWLAVLALATGLLGAGTGVALAHVIIDPPTAATDSFPTLTFRVPNESATAKTVAVTVALPTDHPLGFVSYAPVPGWTATVTTMKLPKPVTDDNITVTTAPSTVTWTAAAGAGIAPGQFVLFTIEGGPIPTVAQLSFPVTQTYSDGTVVKWNEPQAPGADEPENPVPTLLVGSETSTPNEPAATTSTGAGPASSAASIAPGADVTAAAASSDGTARLIGVAGLLVGAIGLLVGALALRSRSTPEGRNGS